MRNNYDELDSEAQYYRNEKKRGRRAQIILPVVFFAAIGVFMLVSVVRHHNKIEAGGKDLTQEASVIDYMALSVGSTIYENTDELDRSYGDYFYLGMDFCEMDQNVTMEVYGHEGVVIFTGDEVVETFCWTCSDDEVTQAEVDTIAEELTAAYGSYEQDSDGVYFWVSSGDEGLGNRENLGRISCGLDDAGVLVIEGSVRE